ncbi:hypothetical protein BG46_20875 [Brucella anthropi]|nr:hypothetical protein BG46_20875 [Brucella anthropi]
MATDVIPFCIKVWIAVLVELRPGIDLSFVAAATLPFALTVALFLSIYAILSALFIIIVACALFHHAVCECISAGPETEGCTGILIYFICGNATGNRQGYKRKQ